MRGPQENAVGEIRTRVRLINAVDDELHRLGQLASDRIRTYEADAVIDTGAVCCVLPVHVVQRLGLSVRGQRVAQYADGRTEPVGLTGPVIVEIMGRDTLEEALVLGDEVLIG